MYFKGTCQFYITRTLKNCQYFGPPASMHLPLIIWDHTCEI